MMRRTIISVSTAVVLALSACSGQAQPSGSQTSAEPAASPSSAISSMAPTEPSITRVLATFTSGNPAYSFRYPASWDRQEGSFRHPITLFPESGPNWVELTLDEVSSGTTLDAYRRIARRRTARWGFTIVATKPATMGGRPALVIESTKVAAMIPTRTAQFFTISGDYVFTLTLNGPEEFFDTDYQTVVSMAQSFRFGA